MQALLRTPDMKTPTPEQLQEFKNNNPHLKVKLTRKGVQIAPRRRQALLEAAPADMQQKTLKANAFVALRSGFLNGQRRVAQAAAAKAAAEGQP